MKDLKQFIKTTIREFLNENVTITDEIVQKVNTFLEEEGYSDYLIPKPFWDNMIAGGSEGSVYKTLNGDIVIKITDSYVNFRNAKILYNEEPKFSVKIIDYFDGFGETTIGYKIYAIVMEKLDVVFKSELNNKLKELYCRLVYKKNYDDILFDKSELKYKFQVITGYNELLNIGITNFDCKGNNLMYDEKNDRIKFIDV